MKYILPLILIGVAVAGFFTFTDPLYQNILDQREQMAAYDEALNNSKALEAERDKLTQKYNSFLPENLDKLQKLLPDNVDNIRLILEIEKIASPYGMILKDIKYDTVAQGEAATEGSTETNKERNVRENINSRKDYGTWDLEFSTQATYNNFVNFVRDLESNLRVVDIASVEFSSNTNNVVGLNPSLNEVYKFSFKIRTYWLKN